MREFTGAEEEKIRLFTAYSTELAFLEPTPNGLKKSIMDATAPIRHLLKRSGLHDYETQLQGEDHKVVFRSQLVTNDGFDERLASLYRPLTKDGDPRIWFSRLRNYANAGDVLGLLSHGGILYLINVTQIPIAGILGDDSRHPLKDLLEDIKRSATRVALELLGLLRTIARRGFIPAEGSGDTAVGRTLETALGIKQNSRKTPDYKGIELKSYRFRKGIRKNLFAQVPDWQLSKFKSSSEILNHFGYQRAGAFRLNCQVCATKPNSQGLRLKLDLEADRLIECSLDRSNWRLCGMDAGTLAKATTRETCRDFLG